VETTHCLARRRASAVAAFVYILGTMVSCWANGSASAQTPDALSQNKRLGRGVNILGYDPIWKDRQKARFQEKYFRLIKEAGFDNARINLHPFWDGKLVADHKIHAAWFDVLDWAVKHALANRLKDKVGVSWNGTEKEQQAILGDFEKAQAWAGQHDRPILLGEFGAYDRGDIESRVRWTNSVARQAEKLGWSWAYWQFDGDFIVYDVKNDAWVEPIRRALVP
jgi:hypothetical protein